MHKVQNALLKIAAFISLSTFLFGCAAGPTAFPNQIYPSYQFYISVNAIADPATPSKGKQFILLPGMKGVKGDDLQYREFAGYVETALSQKGYTRTDTDKKADLLIFLSYGIGEPQVSTYTFSTSYGYSFPVGDMWFSVPAKTQTNQVVNHKIHLVLDAYDLKTPGKQPELWKTSVTSNSRVPNNVEGGIFQVRYYDISDLRIQIPYMIAAAKEYFGGNTRTQQHFIVRGDDQRVLEILK